MKKGLARHPIPVLLLARLAVDARFRGEGLGTQLVRDAALLTAKLSKLVGIRALIVDAKDERARQFYERLNFELKAVLPQHGRDQERPEGHSSCRREIPRSRRASLPVSPVVSQPIRTSA